MTPMFAPNAQNRRPKAEAAESEVLWTPFAGFQTRALECGAFEALFGGAAGPGKTDLLIACAARYAQHAQARGLFLRTTYTDLRDVLDRMHVLYPALGAKWVTSDKRWLWPSGAFTQLGYGETLAQVQRYLGHQYTNILFDELGLVPEENVWTMLKSRVRAPKKDVVPLRMRASANPGGAGHAWLKNRFVVPWRKSGGKVVFDLISKTSRDYIPGTAKDNPALPDSYWDQLRDLPPALQRAMRDGDWDSGLGLFYPELADVERWFETAESLPTPLPGWWDYWGSYDWGYRHPAVFTAYARDGEGRVHVLDTLYQHKVSDEEQCATIKGLKIPREILQRVYAGHDAFAHRMAHSATPETVADVFNRYGVYADKANLDRIAGSAAVRRCFASDAIRFVDTPGNRRLVSDLAALVPDPSKPETPLKVDADSDTGLGGDDGPDCLRYGLATVPFVPFKPSERTAHEANLATGADVPLPWETDVKLMRTGGKEESARRARGPEGDFGTGWGLDFDAEQAQRSAIKIRRDGEPTP